MPAAAARARCKPNGPSATLPSNSKATARRQQQPQHQPQRRQRGRGRRRRRRRPCTPSRWQPTPPPLPRAPLADGFQRSCLHPSPAGHWQPAPRNTVRLLLLSFNVEMVLILFPCRSGLLVSGHRRRARPPLRPPLRRGRRRAAPGRQGRPATGRGGVCVVVACVPEVPRRDLQA